MSRLKNDLEIRIYSSMLRSRVMTTYGGRQRVCPLVQQGLFDNSAPPLTDRRREGLASHDCESIKQPQKRESRGDRVLHDSALGLLSSQVQDRAIGFRPLSLVGLLIARSHPPPPHGQLQRLLLPGTTDLVSTYQARSNAVSKEQAEGGSAEPDAGSCARERPLPKSLSRVP